MTAGAAVPAFVFAPARCTGCGACALACGVENGGGTDPGWRRIHVFNPRHHPALPTWNLSLACNHCDAPACLAACPSAAYRRDEATGAVLLDPARCLGCRYCSWVCPYDAPRFDDATGLMGKCTGCAPRLAAGGEPACTAACPTGALAWGERPAGEPEPRFAGLAPTGLAPRLRLLLHGAAPPLAAPLPVPPAAVQPPPPPRITPRGEWALVLFTLVLPALVALFAAGLARPERAPGPLALLLGGAVAFAASAIHLGRPLRAWRALAHLRSSWLSREIAAAGLFLAAGAAHGLPGLGVGARGALAAVAVLAGGALLFAIDAVYRAVPRLGRPALHGAEALPAAAFLFALAAGPPMLAIGVGLLRALLLAGALRRGAWGLGAGCSTARLALLLAALAPGLPWPAPLALALAGELVDRVAFYAALAPASPRAVMARQVAAAR